VYAYSMFLKWLRKLDSVDAYTQSVLLSAVPKGSQRPKYPLKCIGSFRSHFAKRNGVSFAPFIQYLIRDITELIRMLQSYWICLISQDQMRITGAGRHNFSVYPRMLG
jgi:hypothetical protein